MRNYTDFHFHSKDHGLKEAIYVAQCFKHSQNKIHHWIRLYESTAANSTTLFVEKCGLLVQELNESLTQSH